MEASRSNDGLQMSWVPVRDETGRSRLEARWTPASSEATTAHGATHRTAA